MGKKTLLEAIKNINSISQIDVFEEMLYRLRQFEIITYNELVILLDALREQEEKI